MSGGRPRVGLIGAGTITRTMHLPVLLASGRAEVAWVCDAVEDRAQEVGRAFGVASAPVPRREADLAGLDAVLLAIPVGVRAPLYEVLAGGSAGLLVEKPFARSEEEHRALSLRFPPARLACGLMRRTYRSTRLVRRAVAEGWFGPPRRIVVREGGRTARTGADRTFLDDVGVAGGGALLDLGVHAVDWAIHVAGASQARVRSATLALDGPIDRRAAARVDLSAPSGPVELDLEVSWLEALPNTLTVEFDRVRLQAGCSPEEPLRLLPADSGRPAAVLDGGDGARTSFQAFHLEWEAFLDGLESGIPSPVSADSALLTTCVVEAIYREGRR